MIKGRLWFYVIIRIWNLDIRIFLYFSVFLHDHFESGHFDLVRQENTSGIRFYLKEQGKMRLWRLVRAGVHIESFYIPDSLQWRHNDHDGVSNHQPHGCLLNCLFRRRSKKTSKLRVTGLCAWNSPVTGEFRAQRASNADLFSIWWRHHVRFVNRSRH